MSVVGHLALPVRTSYELVEAHRCGEGFTFISADSGKVVQVDDKSIMVAYANGEVKSYLLGREYGNAAGKVFPRFKVTDRKVGYKFKEGEVLAWDKSYFYRDWIETTQVSIYTGVPAIVAMCETPDTYEDGCGIAAHFAGKMGSEITHTRDMSCTFEEFMELTVKPGDHVESETPIARILPVGVDPKDIEELSMDYLSTSSPRARYPGTIEHIEVFYCGDPKLANESVSKLIRMGDKSRKERSAATGEHPSGEIKEPTYIAQNYVAENTCLVRVYLTHKDTLTVGDKVAFANSLKTIPGLIYNTIYRTQSGIIIDAKFSYKGVMARIVKSPEYMGVINMIVRQIGLNACKLYRGVKL